MDIKLPLVVNLSSKNWWAAIFNMYDEEYNKKKLDFANIRTKTIIRRIRASIVRINALNMRHNSRIMRAENQNRQARIREWFVK